MVFGQEHVEQAPLSRLHLQVFHDGWVAFPSLVAGTQLGCVDGVCGYAHLFDESLNLALGSEERIQGAVDVRVPHPASSLLCR